MIPVDCNVREAIGSQIGAALSTSETLHLEMQPIRRSQLPKFVLGRCPNLDSRRSPRR